MQTWYIFMVLITLSAAFAYINHRFIKMPFVIGLFFLSTLLSVLVLSSKLFLDKPYADLQQFVTSTNISKFILEILLGFLLFAGALHTSWANIKKQLAQITLLALGGVLLSTILIAALFWVVSGWFGLHICFIYCLLFGALISPTDPIAVLGILTRANVPKKMETTIVGESLFNDGVGVVVFIALLETLHSGSNSMEFSRFGLLFLQEAAGGLLFGLAAGLALHYLLRSIDHYETEVLLTIAFVMLGYSGASLLHVSGALAMVIMGLLVGNFQQKKAMSDTTLEYVHKFWELIDVILNAVLFILIALVLVVIELKSTYLMLGLLAIGIVLLARVVVVYLPKLLLPNIANYSGNEAKLLVWGGLRGGLSIALVLSLPEGPEKHTLLVATYCCALFSILVQGLSIEKLAAKWR